MDAAIQKSLQAICTSLESVLPLYMTPPLWIPVSQMPVNSSRKMDRTALREMVLGMSREELTRYSLDETAGHEAHNAATTFNERQLRPLWCSILGLSQHEVGTSSNFLRLGGDSLAAMQMVALVRQADAHITVADILRHPVFKVMATELVVDSAPEQSIQPCSLLLEASRSEITQELAASCGVGVQQVEDIYPTTSLQEGLMALSQTQPGTYLNDMIFGLSATEIDLTRFESAWNQVVQSDDILRTRIAFSERAS